jgi:2-polyprenyl-6-hydroxyphenyl methylase/3-demethylubiquinone-9 3-methyltransferase
MCDEEGKFSFGINWTDYAENIVDEEIVDIHVKDMMGNLLHLPSLLNGPDPHQLLKGKSVIDIGCGSGLSSLSFYKNGCRDITSFDVNEDSIKATNILKDKFCDDARGTEWTVKKGSVLDTNLIENLKSKKYDIVYSWGVLHHTGDMKKAIDNAISLCKSGSILWIALYIKMDRDDGEEIYQKDLAKKIKFNEASNEVKEEMVMQHLRKHYKNPEKWSQPYDGRGMTPLNDTYDWLGGYPYEVALAKDIKELMKKRDFTKIKIDNEDRGSGTNVIYIYQKN